MPSSQTQLLERQLRARVPLTKVLRSKLYLFGMVMVGLLSPSLTSTSLANVLPLVVVFVAWIALIDLGVSRRVDPFGLLFFLFLVFTLIHGITGTGTERGIMTSLVRFFTLASLGLAAFRIGEILPPATLVSVTTCIVVANGLFYVATSLFPALSSLAFFLYYNNAGDLSWYGYFAARFGGFWGNPNGLGLSMALLLPVTLFYAQGRGRYVLIAGLLTLIALSHSRTAFIAAAITLLLFLAFGKLTAKRFALYAVMVVGLVAWFMSSDLATSALMVRAMNFDLGGREDIWFNVASLLPDRSILFGIGDLSAITPVVDNEYLAILVQFGLVGLLSFIAVLASCARAGLGLWRRGEREHGLSLCLTALSVAVASIAASPLTMLKLSFIVVLTLSFLLASARRVPLVNSERPTKFDVGPAYVR